MSATREAGMMVITGVQGVGKTYLNMHVIKDYVKDKFYNKVKGRKCLIFDTNGEYTESQFDRNDIDILYPSFLQVADTKKEVMEEDLQALATAHAAVLVH